MFVIVKSGKAFVEMEDGSLQLTEIGSFYLDLSKNGKYELVNAFPVSETNNQIEFHEMAASKANKEFSNRNLLHNLIPPPFDMVKGQFGNRPLKANDDWKINLTFPYFTTLKHRTEALAELTSHFNSDVYKPFAYKPIPKESSVRPSNLPPPSPLPMQPHQHPVRVVDVSSVSGLFDTPLSSEEILEAVSRELQKQTRKLKEVLKEAEEFKGFIDKLKEQINKEGK